jgi:hypothetical protein
MEKRVIDLEKGILKLYKIYEIEKKKNFQLENDFILLKKEILLLKHRNQIGEMYHYLPNQEKEFRELIDYKEIQRVNKEKNLLKNNKISNKKSILDGLLNNSIVQKKKGKFVIFE